MGASTGTTVMGTGTVAGTGWAAGTGAGTGWAAGWKPSLEHGLAGKPIGISGAVSSGNEDPSGGDTGTEADCKHGADTGTEADCKHGADIGTEAEFC
ncbi:hypothetical protein XELAEV_18004593mg [Xenopus laevis]|uniref:Uncharacterized protein n=1 Tax=Xenopus laevis TaxID=8355 RepID=A0A974BR78_XENLA|nr:hypothetical protein XELAEV_18004593mg [Xenopus laevis]